MVNPFYLLFYLFYKILKPKAKDEKRIPFAAINFIGLIILIHLTILLIVIKVNMNLEYGILKYFDKYFISFSILTIYYFAYYITLKKGNRYLKIVERIDNASSYKRITGYIFLSLYFISPLIISIIYYNSFLLRSLQYSLPCVVLCACMFAG